MGTPAMKTALGTAPEGRFTLNRLRPSGRMGTVPYRGHRRLPDPERVIAWQRTTE